MLSDQYYLLAYVVFIGLICGSFFNVIITRTLSGESIINPPSQCPKCKHPLEWWQNIPIISYLILKGKCNFCRETISVQYPIVEIISASIFGLTFIKFGVTFQFYISLICLSLFLILAGMDLKDKMISTKYSVILILFSLLFNYSNIISAIIAGIICSLSVYLLRKFSYLYLKKEVLGEGDIYLFFAFGSFVGLENMPVYFIVSIFYLFLFTIPELLKNNVNLKLLVFFSWFMIIYLIVFAYKLGLIITGVFGEILIFLNLILSLFFILREIITRIKLSVNLLIVPISPAIFLTVFTYLLFF